MYRSLADCIADLERTGQLIRVTEEVDPYLEMALIQRRVYAARGPALLFTNVKDCRFPCVSNLFGTIERTRFIFRETLRAVGQLVDLKVDPMRALRHPFRYAGVPFAAIRTLPRRVRSASVMRHECRIGELPQIQCWPRDGGSFVTLPQVYTEHPDYPGTRMSNLGMYRIQLSGGQYEPNRQIGMHYQIHRSIGVHHHAAIRRREALRVSVFIGGPPAHTLAAVMPLPEGLSELMFAGALAGRRFRYVRTPGGHVISADADFCITGTVDPQVQLPEGPFGDHLGYYSLAHPFPFIRVDKVYHRAGAIWPFTVVGRPPQEDTTFGEIIHEITGPVIPTVIAGLHAVHAVDAAGVHPLLLAIGSERYVPFDERRPQEILTIANAILGQGQLSLAKYVFIVAKEDDPSLDIHDVPSFFRHVLERVRWETDLHYQTRTTMDTLDYSGHDLNAGSKLVVAAAGKPVRALTTELPADGRLPDGFSNPKVVMPGVVVIEAGGYGERPEAEARVQAWCKFLEVSPEWKTFPLHVIVDDSSFASANLSNFLWTTFTRSDPAPDTSGAFARTTDKHWGCTDAFVIDARIKPHHAPPLEDDPDVVRRVGRLAEKGRSLYGVI